MASEQTSGREALPGLPPTSESHPLQPPVDNIHNPDALAESLRGNASEQSLPGVAKPTDLQIAHVISPGVEAPVIVHPPYVPPAIGTATLRQPPSGDIDSGHRPSPPDSPGLDVVEVPTIPKLSFRKPPNDAHANEGPSSSSNSDLSPGPPLEAITSPRLTGQRLPSFDEVQPSWSWPPPSGPPPGGVPSNPALPVYIGNSTDDSQRDTGLEDSVPEAVSPYVPVTLPDDGSSPMAVHVPPRRAGAPSIQSGSVPYAHDGGKSTGKGKISLGRPNSGTGSLSGLYSLAARTPRISAGGVLSTVPESPELRSPTLGGLQGSENVGDLTPRSITPPHSEDRARKRGIFYDGPSGTPGASRPPDGVRRP